MEANLYNYSAVQNKLKDSTIISGSEYIPKSVVHAIIRFNEAWTCVKYFNLRHTNLPNGWNGTETSFPSLLIPVHKVQ